MKTLLLCVAIVIGAVFGDKLDENEVQINLKRLLNAVEDDVPPPSDNSETKLGEPLEVRQLKEDKSSIGVVDEFGLEVRALAYSIGSDR